MFSSPYVRVHICMLCYVCECAINICLFVIQGDIWAETTFFGLRWKYLALMEGKVFDITEWANCQKGALSHLQPNSHIVQYRIVLGNQQQPNQQQQQTPQQQQQSNAGDRIGGKHANRYLIKCILFKASKH